MKFQERTSTKKSEAGIDWMERLNLGFEFTGAQPAPPVYFICLEPDCLQDAKGLIPREVGIVRLDPAKFKENQASLLNVPNYRCEFPLKLLHFEAKGIK